MMYPIGMSSSNCSNSTNSINNSNGSNSGNSAANSTKISPSSSGITTPTRISIKEANDHLQLLHSRVNELEDIIRQQNGQSAEQEETFRKQLKELKSAKEAQIDELTKTIVRLEEKIKDLESSIKFKNERLEENQTRLTQMDQINDFLPGLENLISILKRVTAQEDTVISPIKTSISCNIPIIGLMDQEINDSYSGHKQINSNSKDDESNVDNSNEVHSFTVDIACQTDIIGDAAITVNNPEISNGGVSANNNNENDPNNFNDVIETSGISTISGSCSSEACYSKRSSIDDTNYKDKVPSEERVGFPINDDGVVDQQWANDKRAKNVRSNRPRRLRKSASVNCQYPTSNNWEKDFYCGPSLNTPIYGPGRTIGYKIHSNSSSSHISGKIEKSFSITSNFSEDEDFPSNGSRGYHK